MRWTDESSLRRMEVVEAIAELPIEGVVVVRTGRRGEALERRRRACLARLLQELTSLGVR